MSNRNKYFILVSFASFFVLQSVVAKENAIKEIVIKIATDKSYCKQLKIKEPELVLEFYTNNKFQFQWYAAVSDERTRIKNFVLLTHTTEYVLNPSAYNACSILNKKPHTKYDSLIAEIRMTDWMLYYLIDVATSHQNFINYNGWNYKPACMDVCWLLLNNDNLEAFIKYVEPDDAGYYKLKNKYHKFYNTPGKPTTEKLEGLNKIKNAVEWYRWISCMRVRSYVIINLAEKKLLFFEYGAVSFESKIVTDIIPLSDIRLSALLKNMRVYNDENYPATLQFNFDNPFHLAISGMDPCVVNDGTKFIRIEKPAEFAKKLGIEENEIKHAVVPEEATPYYELLMRTVPLFIVNVPMNF
ncbi:MAG: hypothetical protein ABI402_12510 [Ferruginibacter sp.]